MRSENEIDNNNYRHSLDFINSLRASKVHRLHTCSFCGWRTFILDFFHVFYLIPSD